ncbi:MAG: SDR family NAD(P)-dependent oxidoreductase, partial [Acidobacteria bacterium]|nr:SDR family NAD(P)-dependent oxidoreductase [Acidobacteriota bacterium]
AAVVEQHGPIDVLVNNAGYGLFGPVQTLGADELRAQFETNVFAVVRLMRAVLPGMIERGGGTIVNVSSILGRIGAPFHGAYASSKFALEGLTESLRTEVWPLGVRVALVEPGLINTAFPENQLMAAGMASDDGAPYDRYVQTYRNRARGAFARGRDPVLVARAIHGIVRARRPRFRYPVGIDSRFGSMAARVLPERVFLSVLGWATRR